MIKKEILNFNLSKVCFFLRANSTKTKKKMFKCSCLFLLRTLDLELENAKELFIYIIFCAKIWLASDFQRHNSPTKCAFILTAIKFGKKKKINILLKANEMVNLDVEISLNVIIQSDFGFRLFYFLVLFCRLDIEQRLKSK